MSEPLRAPEPASHEAGSKHRALDALSAGELCARVNEQAEAEAAVAAVMRREVVKAEQFAEGQKRRARRAVPRRVLALVLLATANLYLWVGNPEWLVFRDPPAPSNDYYDASYKIAVYLQRQRIEKYREIRNELPVLASQAGATVRGVSYQPLPGKQYRLAAGKGARQVVFCSSDSLTVFLGRSLIEMGLASKGIR